MGKERDSLCEGNTILLYHLLQFLQSCCWCIGGKPLQCAVQQVHNGIQGGVAIRRGTAALESGMRLPDDVVFEDLDQPRLPDARFSTQQDRLAVAIFHVLPTLTEEPDLLLPPHQRRESSTCRDL